VEVEIVVDNRKESRVDKYLKLNSVKMKKIILWLMLVLFVGTGFAYNPTNKDQELVVKFVSLFEKVIEQRWEEFREKSIEFLSMISAKTNSQMYKYVFGVVIDNLDLGGLVDPIDEFEDDDNLSLDFISAWWPFYKTSEKVVYRHNTDDFDLQWLDPITFTYIAKVHHYVWYVKDKNWVYLVKDIHWLDRHIEIISIQGIVDIDSFVSAENELIPQFFKDKRFVYYKILNSNDWELGKLDILDPKTFSVVGKSTVGGWHIIKDKNGEYNFFEWIIFTNTLDKSETIYYSPWEKVRNVLFPNIEKIQQWLIDENWIYERFFSRNYYTDWEKLYYDKIFIPWISGNSFEIVRGTNAIKYLAKNKNNVLYINKENITVLDWVDVNSFDILYTEWSDCVFKDSIHNYIIHGANGVLEIID